MDDNEQYRRHQVLRLLVSEAIDHLPEDRRKRVEECARKLRSLMLYYDDDGKYALALVGTEIVGRGDDAPGAIEFPIGLN